MNAESAFVQVQCPANEAGCSLPIVISAPHGGMAKPTGMPTRRGGCHAPDTNTLELAQDLSDALIACTGGTSCPGLVANRIHRSLLDPNRALDPGAEENPLAQ